ncbi:transcriptional regulator, TetR family [Pseudonocardia thermophila]|jgi:Transcriptional regulator|uniref:Transcriptional regulator, TetR family n=1 Tax=Pseudonocardia thermophila TaxID=1848 RepID=A0A1M6WBV2_PSETH|nr:TetR family transcriptional regulator [Pseudonocardia thermophila]SHK91242.1 transcriptional regulator, TetR family [Pseudonocardia thermophila]
MVQAAVQAIRRHGPGVSVAEIAAEAGITKPVLYRHFTDRADLQLAVGQEAAAMLLARLEPALSEQGLEAAAADPRQFIADVVDAFLASIEEEPHLWRFVVHPTLERATDSVVEDAREQIARMLATLIGGRLRQLGLDSGGAEAWAHGLVGMVQSAGDWWLERRTMSRSALTDYLTTLIWGGVSGVLGTAEPASIAPLRAVGQEDARG